MVEVVSGAPVTGDLVSAGPKVTWRPAASSRAAQMMVALPESAMTGTGEPTGLYIRFPIEAQEPPDTVTLNVRAANGRYWRFTGQGPRTGSRGDRVRPVRPGAVLWPRAAERHRRRPDADRFRRALRQDRGQHRVRHRQPCAPGTFSWPPPDASSMRAIRPCANGANAPGPP
ncbi:MAG: hypothetical protein WDN45_07425 [Caulobacteraceae bacterium]